MPKLDIDGLQFHYQQQGTGPDVVLIHAFTSNLSIWALSGIVAELAARYRVTTYDLRGHGISSVTPGGYNSAQMALDLRRLHESLNLGSAHLVGHSYGGVIAMHAALDYPDMVASVVLSDTYFPGLRHLEPNMGQADVWANLRDSLRKVGADIGDRVDFARLFREVARWTPEEYNAVQRELGLPAGRWLAHLGQLAATNAGDEFFEECGLTADRIVQVQQPVTSLYDEFSPFEATCDYLQRHLANCQVEIVPGARHLAPVENPTAFVKLVRKHLQRVASCVSRPY
jgi:pimeloyl-ACP methyl ester carboxylesterase